MTAHLVFALFALACSDGIGYAAGAEFAVTWTSAFSVEYAPITASPGDSVIFSFSGSHDVWMMDSLQAYQDCDFTAGSAAELAGFGVSPYSYVVPQDATDGEIFYFTCSPHCASKSQKLQVIATVPQATVAPSVAPIVAVPTTAPSAAPIVAVPTTAPSAAPVVVVSTAAPSGAPVVAVPTTAPSAASVVAVVTTTSTSTCTEIGWNAAARGADNTVCSNSIVNGTCSGLVPYTDAYAFCAAAGARLCTKTELATDEARNSGCALDRALIWTNNACGSGSMQTAYGSSIVSANGTCAVINEVATFNARCCADSVVAVTTNAPSAAPVVAVPTAAPSAAPVVIVTTNAPSAAPIVAVPIAAPSAAPVVAVTNAPTAAPVVAVPIAAPSAAPVVIVTTNAPSAVPVVAVPIAAPSAAPIVTVTTSAPVSRPTSAPTMVDPSARDAQTTDNASTAIPATDDNTETITIASASVAGVVAVGLLVGVGLSYRARALKGATNEPQASVEMAETA